MGAIASLFIVLLASLLITRMASVALMLTGLSRESARFQARSAFTGVGFTTTEAEQVVGHPVRRRIVMLLMLLGNAGITAAVASLLLTFINVGSGNEGALRCIAIAGILAAFLLIANSRWLDLRMSRIIGWALRKWTRLDVRDYAGLLNLSAGYGVMEFKVEPGDWLTGKTLIELNLLEEGIIILGIYRENGKYIGAPHGRTRVMNNDTLVLYGRLGQLHELDTRPAGTSGDEAHEEAARKHRRLSDRDQK